MKFKGVMTSLAAGALLVSTTCGLKADGSQGLQGSNPLQQVQHIVVIYQENWSFDSLYGQFPGADGLQNGFDTLPQVDKATGYTNLIYATPVPLTGSPLAPDPQFPNVGGYLGLWSNTNQPLPLIPYDFTHYVASNGLTGDIVHRFYHEQLQIDNGALEPKNGDLDKFVTWSDNPGLVLSYIDATGLPEGRLAQVYTLCDRFFHSAYGGSFLNHQWLIAATSPPWTAAIPAGFPSSYDPAHKVLHDNQLTFDGVYMPSTRFSRCWPPFRPAQRRPSAC